ncbi:3-keto-disaccharide hydrolase [Tuwongella immobilis]|uniref:3-keto-alpha-glucoside-1,2-lyase/3-keto-2-hydroxy-glucal hydratase domain-containing protein n=1 Tax=Tuwongella immobilis TaxID=692036 RepID=A0A6C2YIM6_9BACT|nr:DUF1080 domain-containing protein [Tuwongella immobilis]VIP01109.1 Uncharacterized protein OS=Isosphaera pallida (strain ATCC 43644 / DSM 9630 / IS1B) GN=Isop_0606 PE=4 SV=1: DUF1080 [Tuwongella immobilis]VTR97643.1 Uncharacterized protein OS=Isosphaera pallida (strain ATCC 43644 / DSM 9630 / IS1B) GN=Isop_0606 PE=4 SV=1: DUF1080 [Tuwongella immobilis]
MVRSRVVGVLLFGLGMLGMTLSTVQAAEKPIALFNGKDLTGWRTYPDPKLKLAKVPENFVQIRDGVMILPGETMGAIETIDEYSNYTLRLEYRWGEKITKSRNSGILLHVSGPDAVWPRSIEAQVAAGKAGDLWAVSGYQLEGELSRKDPKTGRRYFRSENDIEKPIGEWNVYEITCKNQTITLTVNGKLVNQATKLESNRGKILLQSEGAEIHFRNIQLTPLR